MRHSVSHIKYECRDSKVLWVFFVIPYQHFFPRKNFFESTIKHFPEILESKQVLFGFVAGTANEPHPACGIQVFSINEPWQFTVFIDLKCKNLVDFFIHKYISLKKKNSNEVDYSVLSLRKPFGACADSTFRTCGFHHAKVFTCNSWRDNLRKRSL